MEKTNKWYLHYEFGVHHSYVLVDWEAICVIVNNLSSEFEIHQEYDDSGKIYEIWIQDYYGEKHSIAHTEKKNF